MGSCRASFQIVTVIYCGGVEVGEEMVARDEGILHLTKMRGFIINLDSICMMIVMSKFECEDQREEVMKRSPPL